MSMVEIQKKLKAPKGQYNKFGGFHYRSCEDIVEAVKPILSELGYYLVMSDDVVECGGRVYIKATATVMNGDTPIQTASALAREAQEKKGMDDSQITGTASSYARKYSLNGLFAIEDTKDADTDEHANNQQAAKQASQQAPSSDDDKPWYNNFEDHKQLMIDRMKEGEQPADIVKKLRQKFKVSRETEGKIKALQSEAVPH